MAAKSKSKKQQKSKQTDSKKRRNRSLQNKAEFRKVALLVEQGQELFKSKQYETAIEKFKQALRLRPHDLVVLNNYGATLDNLGKYATALSIYKRALRLNAKDFRLLYNYALVLAKLSRFHDAITAFEQALRYYPSDTETLDDAYIFYDYGTALLTSGQYAAALEQFKKALEKNPNDSRIIINYGFALAVFGQHKAAIEMLERGVHLDSALSQNKSFLYLVLGSLYYRIQHETEGDAYFQRAIEDSNDKDAARIQVAQEIFEEKPYSEKGVAILQEIMETSPYYQEAFQSLTQNLTPKAFFQIFNTHESEDRLKDTELLNRALYHKIANEIVILKETVHLLVSGYNIADNRLPIILNSINDILAGIKQRREYEKVQVKEIPADDYDAVMSIISKTAHDISDFVNNELATLEEKIRIMLVKSAENNVLTKKLNKMLEQIKFSQSALHDLKSVNEGITIRNSDFHIKELFEQWVSTPHIKNSTLTLDIRNGDSIFYGDQEKIKSFVKELIENSLRHNSEHKDLQIKIASKDEHSLPHASKIAFFDKRKFLRIIVGDNGKGIPPEKKEWVFLPLKTSSEEGSGLGLFIIKRTLKEMHGHILETGTQGAKFEIYIPYLQGGETWNA